MLLSFNNECDWTGSFFLLAQIYVLEADASLKIALSVSQSVSLTVVSNPLEKVKAWFDLHSLVQSTMNIWTSITGQYNFLHLTRI